MTWTKELVQAGLDTGMTMSMTNSKHATLDCSTLDNCTGCIFKDSNDECTYYTYTGLTEVITEHFPEALI